MFASTSSLVKLSWSTFLPRYLGPSKRRPILQFRCTSSKSFLRPLLLLHDRWFLSPKISLLPQLLGHHTWNHMLHLHEMVDRPHSYHSRDNLVSADLCCGPT